MELGFDSVAFDLFVNPEDERGDVPVAAAARVAGGLVAARHGHGKPPKSSSCARSVVSNVVPFRLIDGLPRELGPLLFSADDFSSLLSARDPDHPHHTSLGARRGHAKHKTVAVETEGEDSMQNQEHGEEGGEEDEQKALWVRKKGPSGSGHVVLSHVHGGAAADAAGTTVEVRICGESLGAGALARAGLPQDMSGLAVTATIAAVAAGHSKRSGEVVARVGSGGNKQERRKQRAAAH